MVMVGMDMGRFYEVWKDCIVSEIEQEQRIFYITFIKTKQND